MVKGIFLVLLISHSWIGGAFGWSTERTSTSTAVKADTGSVARRSFLSSTAAWGTAAALLVGNPGGDAAAAAAEEEGSSSVYIRKQSVLNNKKEMSYQITIPTSMKEGSKPVKTHLDEVNFVSDSVKRYQYGITVDPVRISSLQEVRECDSV